MRKRILSAHLSDDLRAHDKRKNEMSRTAWFNEKKRLEELERKVPVGRNNKAYAISRLTKSDHRAVFRLTIIWRLLLVKVKELRNNREEYVLTIGGKYAQQYSFF